MHEVEHDFADNKESMDATIGYLAEQIMGFDGEKDPNHSATISMPKAQAEEATEAEPVEPEPVEAEPVEAEPVQKFKIKHEGLEKEVDQDELIKLAQMGFDYTAKTQKLAQERNELSPYVALANQLKEHPELAAEIAAKLRGEAPTKKEVESDDPVENFKREILQEVRKELGTHVAPIQKQQVLDRVKAQIQADPDYNTIHPMIIKMVQDAPPALQKSMFVQLDQDPNAYIEAYNHFKKLKGSAPAAAPAAKPIRTQTKAPILENSGGKSELDEVASAKAKSEKINKDKAKMLRKGDNNSLADWLVSSGSIDNLLN